MFILNLYEKDMEARSRVSVDLWSLLKIKDSHLFQRFKSKWFKKGDINIDFFHASE